jgi:hypothetical protein
MDTLSHYSTLGLRTLVMASKEIEHAQFERWFVQYSKAKNLVEKREVKNLVDKLFPLGAT